MRARLSAPLALIALMGGPVMAAPVAAPPPPVPPAPPSLESSAASAETLVIPKTCLAHLAIIGGPADIHHIRSRLHERSRRGCHGSGPERH
ncbi:hypothetical protein [Gluconobacter roseus]|uniref:hypothetical protein n=1 Tax=Gluconobacter roseus TaxID=586239 RepID=UPI0038D07891